MVVKQYLVQWAVRFVLNLLRFALMTSIAGTGMFALLMLMLFMTTGDGPISPAGQAVTWLARSFNVMLAQVTGSGDFEGGIQEIGTIVMAFLAPYLLALNVVVSLVETLLGHSLRWQALPLKWSLVALWGLWMLSAGLAIGGSNLPPQDLPYWLRVMLLAVMFGLVTAQILLLRCLNARTEQAVRRYLSP